MIVVDLAVLDRHQQLVLTVEVKKFLGMTAEWAADYRRNIMEHGTYPIAPYFLLVTPDKFFLWTKSGNSTEYTMPDYTIEASKYLKPHFATLGTTPEKVSPYLLEVIVENWLDTIVYPEIIGFEPENDQKWISESGLSEAILNGRVFVEREV